MNKFKILWFSIPSLHDSTNGAAISSKLMLEKLAERGIVIKALNATVFDDPRGEAFFHRLDEQLTEEQRRQPRYQFTDHGVEYYVQKTIGHTEMAVTRQDQDRLFVLFCSLLEVFQPDIVICYSGDIFSAAIRHEAQCRGIATAYMLHNAQHAQCCFPDTDLIFTTSKATARLYRERDGVTTIKSTGNFIDPVKVVAPKHEGRYITLVNPSLGKGLAIFVKLAMVCAQRRPELKFLVVRSVGSYEQTLKALHFDDGTKLIPDGDITVNPLPNVDVAEHTQDIRQVYALTRAVVVPSLVHESWGNVATEAVLNGIPVLCADSGGLTEAIAGAGIALKTPEKTQQDYTRIPTDEEIEPWLAALQQILDEDWTERCAAAAKVVDIKNSIDHVLALITPLMRRTITRRNIKKSWYFTSKSIAEKYSKKPQ